MDDAESSAWLMGRPDDYTHEGMQCLTERYDHDRAEAADAHAQAADSTGSVGDRAPEIIGLLTDVATSTCRPRRRRRYNRCACMQGDCRASVSNRKQVVCRPPLGVDTRLDCRPPPPHASRSASGVAMTVEIEGAGMTAAAHVNRDSVAMVSQQSGAQIPNGGETLPDESTVRRARRPRATTISMLIIMISILSGALSSL